MIEIKIMITAAVISIFLILLIREMAAAEYNTPDWAKVAIMVPLLISTLVFIVSCFVSVWSY